MFPLLPSWCHPGAAYCCTATIATDVLAHRYILLSVHHATDVRIISTEPQSFGSYPCGLHPATVLQLLIVLNHCYAIRVRSKDTKQNSNCSTPNPTAGPPGSFKSAS